MSEIVIKIVGEDSGTSSNTTTVQNVSNTANTNSTSKNEQAIYSTLFQHTLQQAKQITVGQVEYELNKYYRLHDDYLGMQQKNIAKSIIDKSVGVGKNIAAGYMMGGILGAAIATVVSAVNIEEEIRHNYEQERIQIRQMDAQLQFSRQRAGYSLTAGSVGENK